MNIKQKIIKSVKLELSKIPQIKSLTLVGSHANLNKKLERITDLDFIIIASKLDSRVFSNINKTLKLIALKYKRKRVSIAVEERIGPIKLKVRNKFNIIIHQIIFDISSYKNYCENSPLTAYDWQRFKPLFGMQLKEFNEIKKIDNEDLIEKRLGIDHYINMISNKNVDCLVYKVTNRNLIVEIEKVRISIKDLIQLMYHALFNTMNNRLKILEGRNSHHEFNKLSYVFFKKFPYIKYKVFFNNLYKLRNKIRRNQKITIATNNLKKITINFLNDIKKSIPS